MSIYALTHSIGIVFIVIATKSDRGPAEWLPPNHQYRCEFLAKFDAIMDKYQLEYQAREKRVINRMKNACAG